MSIFKCKMCGGALEIKGNETVAVCEYCGTKQTLPRLDDDKKANLYDRANHFRRNNDFDKAMGIYEQILNEDNTDAEAYWSLVLCRYGIEYVEDPASHKRVPTVNRAQYTSIFDDDNYKSALQYADSYQKDIYVQEANAINEIQKGILEISSKEEPFDVFICYKETDANGRRTQDSVLANDLYYQLKQEGFKVFFSRITLEDKLDTAYEPYIFAALNSVKVMVVLGTNPEYLNAVWVKNEWSRYLALVKKSGGKKVLIPAYRDMDPYDLPEEFSHLQAQDMSKLGFMQDLIRGIKKIAQADTSKAPAVKGTIIAGGNANIAPLLKRAFMFLEDEDWTSADEYCEKVLDIDPENAYAYLGKLMSELMVKKQESLKDQAEPFDNNNNYQKAIRFADEKLKTVLTGYIEYINTRNEKARLGGIYTRAKNAMSAANTEGAYKEAAVLFESISEYQDSAVLAQSCYENAEIARKDAILAEGKSKMTGEVISNYEAAIKLFESISGWKDADEQIYACQKKIEEIKAKEETDRIEAERKAEERRIAAEKAAKKAFAIGTPIVCACIAFLIVLTTVIIPNNKYNSAVSLMNDEKYDEAIKVFEALNGYKDSENQIKNLYIRKYGEEKWNKIKNIKIGDTYTFGAYEQDNNTSNGKESINWIVLEKYGMSLLLISDKVLDCQPYLYYREYSSNASDTYTTWESCSLRKWLNGTFLNAAFSAEEQAQIKNTNVSADKNPKYSTNPGNATNDKVFLLSVTEAEKYFKSDSARRCKPTEYAAAAVNGVYIASDEDNCCQWWLRSPGDRQDIAAVVGFDGDVNGRGGLVDIGSGKSVTGKSTVYGFGVRPALWIDLA